MEIFTLNSNIEIKNTEEIKPNIQKGEIILRTNVINLICKCFINGSSFYIKPKFRSITGINEKDERFVDERYTILPTRLELNIALQELINKRYLIYRREVISSTQYVFYCCEKLPVFKLGYTPVFQILEYF